MKMHDVIIVGAGTAGLSLGYLLAKENIDVAIVERRRRDLIGDKICGDAIGGHHFINVQVPRPNKESTRLEVDSIILHGRNIKYGVKVISVHGGYVVDRHKYGQQLLKSFENNGGIVYDNTSAIDLIVENNYAVGVKAKTVKKDINFKSRIIIDATGYTASLLYKTPEKWGIEKKIEKRDIIPAYREIVKLKKPFWDIENLHLHFYSRYAPGGYVWLFPWSEDGYHLNFGNGIVGGFSLPKPKTLLYRYAKDILPDYLKDRVIIKSGQWVIPNRRPRHVFVGNGFLAVGDSAIMIDPATAEGIGYGMYGAQIATSVIKEALEAGDYSMDMLWKYQRNYMISSYGVRQARLDVFRILLQAHNDMDIEFVIKTKLLNSDELARARDEDEFISKFSKFMKASKTILHGRYTLLKNLNYTLKMMKKVRELYANYPESYNKIYKWIRKEEMLFKKVKKRLKPYIPEEYK